MDHKTALQQEWALLHKSYDQYDTTALLIKCLAIILTFSAFVFALQPFVAALFILILWLQEAIWKTFQSRTEQRIINIEAALQAQNDDEAFQFYQQWEANRPSTLGLILNYLKQALRPTIAYPYVILIVILFLPEF